MAKSYLDELAAWTKKREKKRQRKDQYVVAFLAVRANVEEAIEAGYSLMTIWEHLTDTGKISYRYETFLRHVHKHIQAPKPKKNGGKGFSFEATPRKEDLI